MNKETKIRELLLRGKSDNNIRFEDVCYFLQKQGFMERVSGGHHIFTKDDLTPLFNLQESKNGKAKNYQIKQIRVFLKQKL